MTGIQSWAETVDPTEAKTASGASSKQPDTSVEVLLAYGARSRRYRNPRHDLSLQTERVITGSLVAWILLLECLDHVNKNVVDCE